MLFLYHFRILKVVNSVVYADSSLSVILTLSSGKDRIASTDLYPRPVHDKKLHTMKPLFSCGHGRKA